MSEYWQDYGNLSAPRRLYLDIDYAVTIVRAVQSDLRAEALCADKQRPSLTAVAIAASSRVLDDALAALERAMRLRDDIFTTGPKAPSRLRQPENR